MSTIGGGQSQKNPAQVYGAGSDSGLGCYMAGLCSFEEGQEPGQLPCIKVDPPYEFDNCNRTLRVPYYVLGCPNITVEVNIWVDTTGSATNNPAPYNSQPNLHVGHGYVKAMCKLDDTGYGKGFAVIMNPNEYIEEGTSWKVNVHPVGQKPT